MKKDRNIAAIGHFRLLPFLDFRSAIAGPLAESLRRGVRHRLVLLCVAVAIMASGQTPARLAGTWEGTLQRGTVKLRVALHLSQAADGLYVGTIEYLDRSSTSRIGRVQLAGDKVRIESAPSFFTGTLDGDRMKGTWTEGSRAIPAEFSRKAASAPAAKRADPPFGPALSMRVPIAPTPVAGDDSKTVLCYELHITNFGNSEVLLRRLEVLGDGAKVSTFEGANLNGILTAVPAGSQMDARNLSPGGTAVAFLWVTLDAAAHVPASLSHRITVGEDNVTGPPVPVSTVKPTAIASPLRGSGWRAAMAPAPDGGHRRALLAVGGSARIAQRFAIDWLRAGPNGGSYSGDRLDNKSYYAYGQEVFAVADGVISAAKDGIPENVPGRTSRAVPITLETVAGNHIILDLGGGRFVCYAHLVPGSPRVKVGEHVRKGQVLGLLGNSGNSTEPHLHFQVMDRNSTLGAEGLPYVFDSGETVLQWRRLKSR